MELNQIRYFVTLAQTLHFTRAAEACNVSQPALTRAIQKLEEELGGPLFHRERSLTQLTELGRHMLPPLERALGAARDAKMIAASFRRRETSPLRVGLEFSIPASVVTPIMSALHGHNADIELTLRAGSQPDLSERMLHGEIDIALLVDSPDVPERLHRWRMFAERYMVACQPEHRFKEQQAVAPGDLANECLLLLEDAACPIRKYLGGLWDQNDIRPRRQHFGNSTEQLLDMVQADLGVSVLGERQPIAMTFMLRPIAAEPAGRTIILATPAGRQLGPTPAMFVRLMRARAWGSDGQPSSSLSEAA
jgi:LysR family hydrogen peroxide-inducible transcriptional activator